MADLHASQHSSAQPSWGTPKAIVDIAHAVLGRIDLDPFSSAEWNQTVGAKRYFDEAANAFSFQWFADLAITPSTALVNPPGDQRGAKAKLAWKLTEWNHREGWLGGGVVWVAFNLGQLRTLQLSGAPRSPLHPDFVRCIPARRIPYDAAPGVPSSHPSHDTAIVLLPAHGELGDQQREMFRVACRDLGGVF